MCRIFGWVAVALLVPFVSDGHGQDAEPEPIPDLMQRKLADAQQILEGITTNDFDRAKKHADALVKATGQDNWLVLRTPEYDQYTAEFRRGAGMIARAAADKNTEAAALAYVGLTLTCVKCHNHVRDERKAFDD